MHDIGTNWKFNHKSETGVRCYPVTTPRKYLCATCLTRVENINAHGFLCRKRERRIERINRTVGRILGFSFYQIPGANPSLVFCIYKAAKGVQARGLHKRVLNDFGSVSYEHVMRTASAMIRNGLLIRDDEGNYTGIEMQATEAQIKIEEARKRLTLQIERFKTCQDKVSLEALALSTAELVLGFLDTADEVAASLGLAE